MTIRKISPVLAVIGWVSFGVFAQAPIALTASVRKARVLVGEGIAINLHLKVLSALEMETVERNRDRTTVTIETLTGGAPQRLSGKDYVSLHKRHPLDQIGEKFRSQTGAAWDAQLNLLDYAKPLAVGRYRISIAYRWGNEPAAVVKANPVEVVVAPTQMLSLSARWMGGTTAREQLASLWKADDSGKVHWFYTVADRRDPSVLTSSVDLGIVDAPAAVKPSLAHINDIAENQFDRIAVWVDGERLCWWRVNALDPPAVPRSCLDLNFDSKQPILLADPPLQLRDGGLAAVVTGVGRSGPMAMWIHLGKDGKSDVRNRPIQSPGLGAIVWKEAEDSPSGTLYIASPSGRISRMESAGKEQPVFDAAGQQVLLTQTQWLGNGLVFGVFRRGQNLEVQRFGPGAPEKLSSWSMPDGWRIEQAEGFNAGVAVVCRTVSGGLAVFDSKGMHQFKSGTVVATPTSLILIEHRRGQGFVITPVN